MDRCPVTARAINMDHLSFVLLPSPRPKLSLAVVQQSDILLFDRSRVRSRFGLWL